MGAYGSVVEHGIRIAGTPVRFRLGPQTGENFSSGRIAETGIRFPSGPPFQICMRSYPLILYLVITLEICYNIFDGFSRGH